MDRIHWTGTSRAEHGKEAMAVPGAQEAMAGGLRGRGLIPPPGHSSRNPSTPPQKKKSLGHLGGIRSPPALETETGKGHTKTKPST